MANNRTHRVWLHNTTSPIDNAITWAMNDMDSTVMFLVSGDSDRFDVKVVDGDFGAEIFLVAWTSCPAEAQVSGSHPNKVCKGQKIHFNLPHMSSYTLAERRSAACHELGHTVALDHVWNTESQSCMRGNVIDRGTTYTGHDKSKIDENY